MSAPRRRDTFIALRARRQALRIASAVAFSRLSAKIAICHHCHRPLDWRRFDFESPAMFCPVCGTRNMLPDHLRSPEPRHNCADEVENWPVPLADAPPRDAAEHCFARWSEVNSGVIGVLLMIGFVTLLAMCLIAFVQA
jgi:hypothetical protein